jgi:uncharacterized protein YbjQ (UPF0145 family)
VTGRAPEPSDVRAELARAAAWLAEGGRSPDSRAATSDLSMDEALLLHSIGWEPIELVFGGSVTSIQVGVWTWGMGELTSPSDAHNLAVEHASNRLGQECAAVGGHGVVGVRVDLEIHPRHVDVALVGTAVRPVAKTSHPPGRPFVSDLSARDFVLLSNSGWEPLGLAFGASFVYAPRRNASTAIRQSSQNVELTNLTQALYAARETAMERMQASGIRLGAQGVVGVQVEEGPMRFARHVIGFTARGTAVRLGADGHRHIRPELVLPLDDAVVQFEAESLRAQG